MYVTSALNFQMKKVKQRNTTFINNNLQCSDQQPVNELAVSGRKQSQGRNAAASDEENNGHGLVVSD